MFRIAMSVLALVLSACSLLSSTAGLRVSTEDRERLSREYVGREFVLASSMFVGDFFGETDRRLIDPRPADVLELFHHDGDRAVVRPFSGEVVYAGTPVRVREVVYPTESGVDVVLDERSGLAPTAHTWMVLEPVEGSGEIMVLVLPRTIEGAEVFRAAVQARLVDPDGDEDEGEDGARSKSDRPAFPQRRGR